MILRRLRVRAFRNYGEAVLEPSPRLTVLWGANAQGKTNLLEAIYVLATSQSFRTTRTAELIAEGAPEALIEGDVEGPAGASRLRMVLQGGVRRVQRDGKGVRGRRDWLGVLPAVVFGPEDLSVLRGPTEGRRRTLDLALSTVDPVYFDGLRAFGRALAQRNALLKAEPFDRASFEAWTDTFAATGAEITRRRMRYLRDLAPLVAAAEAEISGGEAPLAFAYEPSVGTTDPDDPEYAAAYRADVRAREGDERRRGLTLSGPQRDDWRATLGGRDLRAVGSQGQHRTFAIAFKLAEARALAQATGAAPLFLLDDVSSELDADRLARLLEVLLSSTFQVFVTTTRRDLFASAEAPALRRYHVVAGRLEADP